VAMVSALALAFGAAEASAQQPQQAPQGQRQRPAGGGGGGGGNPDARSGPRPESMGPSPMKRKPDLRVPPPYNYATFQDPIAMADNVWMNELTIIEMRDLVKTYGYHTAIVPNGTQESNGPYLTTGKHNHVLRVTADRIARTLGKALVVPTIMWDTGDPSKMTTPGEIKLRPETMDAVLHDVANSLKAQGFTEIYFIGDSGSNQAYLTKAADELAQEWKGQNVIVSHIREYYNYGDVLKYENDVLGVGELDSGLDGYHDDYYITSLIMNDSPAHVRYDQRVRVGLNQINGLPLELNQALERGRKIAQFRADVTVAAIAKRREAAKSTQEAAR
jgi:creatinine amidohydrolase/Fe(II)-dependent formamide hydrolase-like protein